MTQRANAKCKVCREPSTMTVGLYRVCSMSCALTLARKNQAATERKRAKVERRAHREAKAKVNPLATLKREAQAAVNAYVRARDAHLPCMTCGRTTAGQWDAGHWKTTKARPDIRFDPANIHKQCSQCNQFEGGGLHPNYLPELVRRIGQAEVDRLLVQTIRRYTREELTAIRDDFRQRKRELDRQPTNGTTQNPHSGNLSP